MSELTFGRLRAANIQRLPLFKNTLGIAAHTTRDGSDWSPAQWLQALVGELGEYANQRKKFERGDIAQTTFYAAASEELADVAVYLDLLACRLGIDLGMAIIAKFNRTSMRAGCPEIQLLVECQHANARPPADGSEGPWPCPDCGCELVARENSHGGR
jgi:NTP pyrophosphatase (non-canonical NTP hydrolase)